MWWNWIMNLVSGHNRPAGHGSVLDGAVWRGAIAKMPKMCEITWNNESRKGVSDDRPPLAKSLLTK